MSRKKNKNNIGTYITSIIVVIIISLVGFLLSKKVITIDISKNSNNTGNITETKDKKNYYQSSIITGNVQIIEIPYNIKVGTNYKLRLNNKTFYVKSDKYSLSNYLDKKINIKAEIIGFSSDNIPVLSIQNIQNLEETEEIKNKDNILTGENLSGNDENIEDENKNLLYKGVSINLENTDYKVEENSGDIILYKEVITSGTNLTGNNLSGINLNGTKINYLTISPFKCQKGSNLYDCEKLQNQFKLYKFSKFTNNNGITFYKIPEINQYTVLSNEYGYNITPLKGNIYKLTQYINIKDTSLLKKQLILNTCKNNKNNLVKILNIQNSGDNYVVNGFDNNSNKIECKLTISGNSMLIGKLKSFKIIQKDLKTSELDENKYLKYKSKAFLYTLYMPKSIKYNSKVSKEDFGVSGLNCKQVVNIADWKTGNLKNPDVKVYYCKTDLSKDDIDGFLKRKQFSYIIKQVSGKTFIITYTPGKIAEKILENLKIY